ncbi:MAG: Co2+/Mg2+ efflux protein ApaG [Rhodospirillaceae bacterium]|nr:Co2+/Mg2+ efflux protein ApaG [Rhodospirillaceae bacterium]
MYEKTTHAIKVTAQVFYLDDQSAPEDEHYVWAYKIKIKNDREETVKLIHRHWCITDRHGRLQEVKGAGVVGEQPVLEPGDSFEYTSGTPLSTPSGIMVGTYKMESEQGQHFDVGIPAFSLDSPYDISTIN